MKKIFTILLSFVSFGIFAQVADTIYSNGQKIACSVREVDQEAVKYVYPGEDVINTLYINAIQKIVFKSGRVQTFAAATSYKTVNGAGDFDNVTLTSIALEVKGLFKVGDVSSKARGTTTLSSMEKVKERATRKLKTVAAMMGANIILLTQNQTTDNQMGTRFQAGHATATNMTGVAYSNKLPNFDDFQKLIGTNTYFQVYQTILLSGSDADYEVTTSTKGLQILKVYNESGLIMINAKIDGTDNPTYRVIGFTNNEFTLVWKDGDDIYNYIIRLSQSQSNSQPTTTAQGNNTTTAPAGTFQVNDRVSVNDDGKWVTGTITAVTEKGTYLVKWDDNGKIDEVEGKDLTKGSTYTGAFKVNDRVSVDDDGKWVDGKIMGITDKGSYLVKWDDNGKVDQVEEKDLTPYSPPSGKYKVDDKVAIKDGTNWVTGVVVSVTAKGTYMVKWDDNHKTDEVDERDLTKLK